MSQASTSPRDRSVEPTPLGRAPTPPRRPAPALDGAERSGRSDDAGRRRRPEPLSAPTPRRRGGAPLFPARRRAARGARARPPVVAGRRSLRLDRQRLCRRRQGADHPASHRPDRRRACRRRAARRRRRSAVRHRPGALPHRARARAGASGGGARWSSPICAPSYASNEDQIKMGQEAVDLRQADYDRKAALVRTRAGTQAEVDTSNAALVQAKQILEFVREQQDIDQGQARRRARRLDRDLSRLHPGQGPGWRTPSAILKQHQRDGADRRRGDAGRPNRARPRRARRAARVRRRRGHGALGRRQPEGIGPHLRARRPAARR